MRSNISLCHILLLLYVQMSAEIAFIGTVSGPHFLAPTTPERKYTRNGMLKKEGMRPQRLLFGHSFLRYSHLIYDMLQCVTLIEEHVGRTGVYLLMVGQSRRPGIVS